MYKYEIRIIGYKVKNKHYRKDIQHNILYKIYHTQCNM